MRRSILTALVASACALMLSSGSHADAAKASCGRMLSSRAWTGSYTVDCAVTIPKNITLTIEPGSTIVLSRAITVEGRIIATDASFSGAAGLKVATGGRVTISDSSFSNTRVELAGGSNQGSNVTLDNISASSTKFLAGALARTAAGSYKIMSSDLSNSSVLLVMSKPSQVTNNSFSSTSVKLVGSNPLVTGNTFVSSPLTLGDNGKGSLVTDTARVSSNTIDAASALSVAKIKFGGDLSAPTLNTTGAITVPYGSTVSLSNTETSGNATWVVNGSLIINGGSFQARSVAVNSLRYTDVSAQLSISDAAVATPVSVGGGASVEINRSSLSSSPITNMITSPSATKTSDSVKVFDSTLTSSPVTMRRLRSPLHMDQFDIGVTLASSSFDSSPIDVWSSATVSVTGNTFNDSTARIAGGTPAVSANTFTDSHLTLGDNVGYGTLTDLAAVTGNTSSPDNTVTIGRTLLGGSFAGLDLSLHQSASLTVPAGRTVVLSSTSISGLGILNVFGDLTLNSGGLSTSRTFVGAASQAAASAALQVNGAELSGDVAISGGAVVEITASGIQDATIRASSAPNTGIRVGDSLTITDSALTDSRVQNHRASHLEHPLAFTFDNNMVTRGSVASVSSNTTSVTDSTFSDSSLHLIGGTPTLTRNSFSATTKVTLGETALYAALDTNLAGLSSNTTTPANTGEITLGRVSITPATSFSGFAAVELPTTWSSLTIPQAMTISLADITVKGSGSLKVFGTLNTSSVVLSQGSLFVSAASSSAPQARLNIADSALTTALSLDGGATVNVTDSSLSGASIRYATSPAIPTRALDGVEVLSSTITNSQIVLRRYSPSVTAPFSFKLDSSTITSSAVTAWTTVSPVITNNTATSLALTLVGGAPTVKNNAFSGTGSTTFGDVLASTLETTLLSNVANNTVAPSAAASTRTITLGRVTLGTWQHDGADGFSTIESTTREVSSQDLVSASIANVTIKGTAPWRIGGTLDVSNADWETPSIETSTATASLSIDASRVTGGSIAAGFNGQVTLNNSTTLGTSLLAGTPKVVAGQFRAATAGDLLIVNSTVTSSPIITQASSALSITDSTLTASALTIQQLNEVSILSSTLNTSPVDALKSTLMIEASTLRSSALSATGGSTTFKDGSAVIVDHAATGVSISAGSLTVTGTTGEPVVFTGECDPSNASASVRCSTEPQNLRPARLVALSNASTITVDHAVFALAHTAVALDPYTKGVGQAELGSTSKGFFNSDFILTDDAVTFAPVWSITGCRAEAYLPVVDSYFQQGHQWNVSLQKIAADGIRSYLSGPADFSGLKRGLIATNFTTGSWLAGLSSSNNASWVSPQISSANFGSLAIDALLNTQAHAAVPQTPETNKLPYYAQLCSFSVPTTPAASAIGIPVAVPRLTTPVVPWSSQSNDLSLDGETTPRHAYTAGLASALGLGSERSATEMVVTRIPVLMIPRADLERVFPVDDFTPQQTPVPGTLTLSRSAENNPVLVARWGTPASSRVVGYHVELSRDNGPWTRLTPALGIPGRYNTMHLIECSYTSDCRVRVTTIGFDGDSEPGEVVLRQKAPWLR